MAVDKLVDSGKLDACCAAEAAAIIAKGGGTAPLAYDFVNNKGFADAIAAIPSGGTPVIQPLSVTENGTYTAPSGVDGYSPVTVNVSGGGETFVGTYKILHETVTVESAYSGDVMAFANLLMGLTSFSDKKFIWMSQKPKTEYIQNDWFCGGTEISYDFGLRNKYGYRYRNGAWAATMFVAGYDAAFTAGSEFDVYAIEWTPLIGG